jgi:hypothetical protein
VTTDQAGPYLRVLDDLVPTALHVTEQYCNNRIEAAPPGDSVHRARTGRLSCTLWQHTQARPN